MQHSRRFDRVKSRILSIAWGPPVPRTANRPSTVASGESSDEDDYEDDWSDAWLVTGGSDNSLRKWDVKTGRAVERMATDKIRGERTLVWTVGVLGYIHLQAVGFFAYRALAEMVPLYLVTPLGWSNSGIREHARNFRPSRRMVQMCFVWP